MFKKSLISSALVVALFSGLSTPSFAKASPERVVVKRDSQHQMKRGSDRALYFRLQTPAVTGSVTNPLSPSHLTYERARQGVYRVAAKISGRQAKSIALKRYPGAEYLDTKLVGGHTYHIKVVFRGQRIEVRVDANTGRVLGTS